MDITKLSIEGKGVISLVDILKRKFSGYYFSSDNIFAFATTEYSIRVNTDMLSVIILNLKNRNKCEIEIISGGSAVGLIQIVWNPERSRNGQIVKILDEICKENSWKLNKE